MQTTTMRELRRRTAYLLRPSSRGLPEHQVAGGDQGEELGEPDLGQADDQADSGTDPAGGE